MLYVTDSESRDAPGYGHHPGWRRGVRIGSLKDGMVTDFIPDSDPNPDAGTTSGGEGIWVDSKGAVVQRPGASRSGWCATCPMTSVPRDDRAGLGHHLGRQRQAFLGRGHWRRGRPAAPPDRRH